MGRLVSYMFTSVDGYIADREGGIDWVPIDDELMRFANKSFAAASGIVFGRRVYEGFVEYWDHLDASSATPLEVEFASIFAKLPRYVASTTLTTVDPRAILVTGDVAGAIGAATDRADGDVLLICGPALRATLARASVLDRVRVLVAPTVLGTGQRLFDALGEPLRLQLVGTRRFGAGVVMLDYAVGPEDASSTPSS